MNRVWALVVEIGVAALVAVGILSIIRFLEECFLTPGPLTLAVRVRTEEDIRDLDMLLAEAKRHSARTRGQAPVVLIDDALVAKGEDGTPLLPPRMQGLMDRFGAVWYVVRIQE